MSTNTVVEQANSVSAANVDVVELSKLSQVKLREHAVTLGLALPKSWNKSELINVIERAADGEEFPTYAIVEGEPPMPHTPDEPAAVPPSGEDEVAERLAAAKNLVEKTQAEAEKRAAEKKARSRKKGQAYREASVDELARLGDAIGYALGFIRWAGQRITKSNLGLAELLPALGEALDSDALALGQEGMIEGYTRAQKQTKFKSPALDRFGLNADLSSVVLNEMIAHLPEGGEDFEPTQALNNADVSALGIELGATPEPEIDEDEEAEIERTMALAREVAE